MAKKMQIGKRLKISKAQQYMLGAVTVASFVLGICLVISVYFLKYIRYDSAVIGAKADAIQGYSDTIKNIGVCNKPSGKIYKDKEIEKCDPNNVNASDVPGTLRYNVLIDMAANKDLESVGRNDLSVCMDSKGNRLTYEKLVQRYENATTEEDRLKNYQIFSMCSALRAIPDALPAAENELALMASVDKIFKMSSWEPDYIVPGENAVSDIDGLEALGVVLVMETDPTTVIRVLRNIEKSIRDVDVRTASIEWTSSGIELRGEATAYYTDVSLIKEGLVTVNGTGRVIKTSAAKLGAEEE